MPVIDRNKLAEAVRRARRAARHVVLLGPIQQTQSPSRLLLSIVTPAFNEAQNLPVFYDRLCKTM